MTVLTRYLLRAHIGPFLFAFVALTGVILINTLAKELANLAGKGLPLEVVFEFFVLSLPANIALTLPMAVLVAVLYTFSTLAAENEITALRASGVDLRRVALPLVVSAAIVALAMVWFSDRVLPAANYRWRVLMTDVAATRPLLALRPQTINPIRTNDGSTPYYLEADEIETETGMMRDVAIYDVSDPRVTRTINADSGRMVMNATRTDLLLTLYDGDIREVDFNEMANFQVIEFGQQVMRVEGVSDRLERTGESEFRTDRDMTIAMMRERVDTLRSELQTLVAEQAGATDDASGATEGADGEAGAARRSRRGGSGSSEALAAATLASSTGSMDSGSRPAQGAPSQDDLIRAEEQRYTQGRIRTLQGQIREFQVEIQKKFSIAAATLVFVLIGIPIALRFPRGGIGMVIGVSLAIFGIYYVGLIGGETLGDGGYIPPGIAMWATNIVFGVL
ncbi:MAG: LptF/LptG family permease, partial [Gemmatimonadota bacterium]